MKIIKKNDRCVYLFLFLLFNFYLFIPNQVLGNGFPTKAEKSIELIGTWYFYPFQLYSGKDLNEISRKDSNIEHIELQEPLLVHIPSPWNKYKRGRMNEESFGSNGYGTFYSFLTDLIPGEKYALRLNYVASSHKIFVGDSNIPICKAGIVARNKEEYRPDYKHVLCSFTADSTSMRLAIQIANFHHVNGGFREAPIIGTFENLHKEYYTQVTSYGLVFALLFGAVLKLVIGLIGNDFNIRKLYIIGFIICPIIFLMGYEIRLGRELTDKIDFFFQVRSHMFVLPFCIGMLILFVSTWVISKKARFSAYLVSGILIALALFYAVGSFDLVIQFFLFNLKMTGLAFVFFIIYVFYVLLTNEEQIWVLSFGMIVISITVLGAILNFFNIIHVPYLLLCGLSIFVLTLVSQDAIDMNIKRIQQNRLIDKNKDSLKKLNLFLPLSHLNKISHNWKNSFGPGSFYNVDACIMFLRIEPIRSKDISQEKLLKMHSHFAKEVADFTRKYEGTLERISIGRYIISFRDDPAIALKLAVDLRMQVRSWGKTMNEYILFRCGIHYGSAVWGLYGSTERWSGGYIGDAVNIAARLEMLCGRYHSAILMSQDSFFQSAHMDNYVVRMLEPVKLKGKEDHVFVYEVLSGLPDDLLDSYIQARNEFGQGLQAFLSKDLQIAVYIFQHVLEINPNDYAAKLYLERTMNILNKGEDKEWNPIESLSTK